MPAAEPLTPWGPISWATPEVGTPERILDAALARFSAQGVSATTMSQLAADVGISRVWLYRYYENRDAVARALLGREAHRLLAALVAIDDPDAPLADVAVTAFDRTVALLRGSALLQRLLTVEPALVAPFLTSDRGSLVRRATGVVARTLQARGGLAPAQARAVAETMVRLAGSIAVSNDGAIDFDDARQRRAYARRIIPLLLPPHQ